MRSSRIFPRESLRIFNIRPLFFYAETFFERSKNSLPPPTRFFPSKNYRRFSRLEKKKPPSFPLPIREHRERRPPNNRALDPPGTRFEARKSESRDCSVRRGKEGGEKVYWRLSNRWPHFVVIGRYNKWKLRSAWRRLLPIEWLIIGNQCRERERDDFVHNTCTKRRVKDAFFVAQVRAFSIYLCPSIYLSLYPGDDISRSKSLGNARNAITARVGRAFHFRSTSKTNRRSR